MEIQFAVAKVGKYASSESGDTLEMIERPHGGISFVLVDGQRSGRSAKAISNVVARKAVQLLAEGVRDGAVARAAHDYLFTYRGGKVSATLNILSVDARSRTVVISRNNPAPVVVYTAKQGLFLLDEPSTAVGVHHNTKPIITELPLDIDTLVVVFTDGIQNAGSPSGERKLDARAIIQSFLESGVWQPRHLVDRLLDEAVDFYDGRPRDDISVIAVRVGNSPEDKVRRLYGRLPLEG